MGVSRVDGLHAERVEGEMVVYDAAHTEVHALNESAAVVFDLCDGATSIDEMVVAVAERSGLPADEGIVRLALAELADAGLTEPVSETVGLSRRSLIRRLSLTAVAVAALPVVETMVAPMPAAALSTQRPSSTTATTSSGVSPTNTSAPSPSPSPAPVPSPSPSPSPSPLPTPSPVPSPSPLPTPSPVPSPSPLPTPAP